MNQMLSNIIVVIMSVIAIAAGIYAWWAENVGISGNPEKDEDIKNTETKETEMAEEDRYECDKADK